jgi:RNA polymerase sigma-70 factor (ECF subfamily)
VLSVVEEATPQTLFERRWALSILEQVLARLRAEFAAAGNADQFESLSMFQNRDSDEVGYEELAAQMGVSAGSLRMSVHRMRRKYQRILREEITETVSTPGEVDDEIRFLVSTRSA